MLGIDVGADTTVALRLSHDMGSERGLARGLRTVDFGDTATRKTTDTESKIEGERTGRDRLDRHRVLLAHLHDRALAVLLLDLAERHLECLVGLVVTFHHVPACFLLIPMLPGWCWGCVVDGLEPTDGV